MSSPTTTPAASAHNISRYMQALSSNLTSLMGELARASAPAAPASNDGILVQLQLIVAQLTQVNRRLDAIEIALPPNGNVVPAELIPWNPLLRPTPAENNARARAHNATARHSSDALLPLYNANNNTLVGFPPTLGHLGHLDPTTAEYLRKAFGLPDDHGALRAFCGVDPVHYYQAAMHSILHEDVALLRMHRREERDAAIAAAGPATSVTRLAAMVHNLAARAHNREADCSDYGIVPIHDDRNLAVDGFPRSFEKLTPPYLADVIYFLGEYGLSTEVEGCVHRWETFVGVDVNDMGDCHYHTQREWLW